jgi:hypothetical protein
MPGAHRRERVGQVTNERDERSEEQLGDGDGVPRRRVDDGDAERVASVTSMLSMPTPARPTTQATPARVARQSSRFARRWRRSG